MCPPAKTRICSQNFHLRIRHLQFNFPTSKLNIDLMLCIVGVILTSQMRWSSWPKVLGGKITVPKNAFVSPRINPSLLEGGFSWAAIGLTTLLQLFTPLSPLLTFNTPLSHSPFLHSGGGCVEVAEAIGGATLRLGTGSLGTLTLSGPGRPGRLEMGFGIWPPGGVGAAARGVGLSR